MARAIRNENTIFGNVHLGKLEGSYEELTITFDSSMEDETWTCVSSDESESFSGTVDSTLTVTLNLGLKNTVYTIQCGGVTAEYTSGGISIVDFNNLSKFPNAMKNLAMNSNTHTDSNGYVFKASASSERFPAFNAFNGSLGSGAGDWWRPSDFSVNGWIMLEVPVDCKILSHTIYLSNDSTATVGILFQGSNDGVNFETLGDADFGTNSGYLERTVTLTNPSAYKYYRWYYATNTGWSGTYIREITFNTINVDSIPKKTTSITFDLTLYKYGYQYGEDYELATDVGGNGATDDYITLMSFTSEGDITVNITPFQLKTNTSSDEGYFSLVVDGVTKYKKTLDTDTWTALTDIVPVDLVDGETLECRVGFGGTHNGCNFLYRQYQSS